MAPPFSIPGLEFQAENGVPASPWVFQVQSKMASPTSHFGHSSLLFPPTILQVNCQSGSNLWSPENP